MKTKLSSLPTRVSKVALLALLIIPATTFARPCSSCDSGGSSGPRPPKAPLNYTLNIQTIVCREAEEAPAMDELDLYADGRHLVNQDIGQGGRIHPNVETHFGRSVYVEIIEDDGNRWVDRNDYIFSHTIQGIPTNGVQMLTFASDDAVYDVYYEVRRN